MSDLNNVEKLSPLTRFCMTIGQIPASYLVSMTYEEQLLWLCDYLKNTVIPTVNNNADCVTELQNLYKVLKNYVDNYFDDLDVQEEINNKLDEMTSNGTLKFIIELYFNELNSKIIENSTSIDELNNNTIKNNQHNSITEDMLSQEVKEMLTGGSVPVVGANSVGTENIIDNSVTLLKLDDDLKDNFIKNYENISYSRNLQGYAKIDNGDLAIDTDSNYRYAIVDLEKDKIYDINGFNYYVVCGIIIVDSSDNSVVLSSRSQSTGSQGLKPVNLSFRTNKAGLKAYISAGISSLTAYTDFVLNNISINKVDFLTLNNKKSNIEPLYSVNGKFIHTSTTINNIPIEMPTEECSYSVYKMNKSCKYNIKSANLWYISGIVITNNKMEVIYSSSSQNTSTIQELDYTFTAETDGFIILSSHSTRFTSYIKLQDEISILNEKLESVENHYSNKKWIAMGDSLTDASTLGTNVKNYVNYVSDKLGLTALNYGHGGAGYKARFLNNQAFYQIANTLDNDVDVITIFGSFNDTYTTQDNYGLGTIDDTTTDTILGSVNVTLDTLIENYPNAVIGIIIPTPWSARNMYNATEEQKTRTINYVNGLIAICEKRSIPYLDLFKNSNLYPWNEDFRNTFYLNADGTHPNTLGHKKFASQIVEFIKSILY